MFGKLWYKSCQFLFNDFGILKLFMAVCFFGLVIDEIYVCVVEKPTLTRNVKEDLSKEDSPSVTLCPGPSTDPGELYSRGYNDIWDYKSGVKHSSLNDFNFIGWTGENNSETIPEVSSAILSSPSPKPEPKNN